MSLKSPFTTKIERGAYSAIVFIDGDLVVAEDNVGTMIKEDSVAATTIQAALDSISSGMVVVAPGTYTITGTNGVGIDANKILHIQRGATLKEGASVNPYCLVRLKGNYAMVEGNGILDGNKANQVSGEGIGVCADLTTSNNTTVGLTVKDTRGYGVFYTNATYGLIHRVRALNTDGDGGIAVNHEADHVTVAECFVKDSAHNGILGWGGGDTRPNVCNRCIFANNQVENCGEAAIFLNAHDYAIVKGNNVRDTVDMGINFEFCQHGVITGNVAQYNKFAGIALYNSSSYITITGNLSEGNIENASNQGGLGIFLYGNSGQCNQNVVSGNVVKGNHKHGIYLLGEANYNIIASNMVYDNSKLTNNTFDGISLDANCDYNNIQNNTIRYNGGNDQRCGIRINNANCNANLVTNNDLNHSGVTAPFSDAGTGSVTTAGNRT